MSDKDLREEHKLSATDGSKAGVVALFNAVQETVEELPASKRYDVSIEITEAADE